MAQPSETQTGLAYGIGAYALWGLFPLYFPLLEPAGWLEILAQRMAWSLVVVLVLLALTSGFGTLRRVVRQPVQAARLALAGVLITVNWGVYIWAVNAGHVVEASLGYFINPLFTILLGVVVLRERLRPVQWLAVALGTAAVVVITVDYGRLPWIALTLAGSFGVYGFLKKKAVVGPADSLAVETGTMFIPAVVTLGVIAARGDLEFGQHGVGNTLLVVSSGVVTAVPLLLFAAASRHLPLSVLGLLQYLTPVLQYAVGVGIRHESVPFTEFIGFCLVWLALIVLTADSVRHSLRTARRAREPVPV